MASVQMNTRIDRAVKERGDRALAAAGLNPPQVVRAVWGFAARNEGRPQAVRDLMEELGEPHADAGRDAAAREGWAIMDEGLARLGVSRASSSVPDDPSAFYEAVRADAVDERLERWGVR